MWANLSITLVVIVLFNINTIQCSNKTRLKTNNELPLTESLDNSYLNLYEFNEITIHKNPITKRQLTEEETMDEEEFDANDTYFDMTNMTREDQILIEKYTVLKMWTWILIFFHCVVFVVGLLGNVLVCVAVYRNHSMRTVTNYFIVNLAVADALVILFCLPFSVVWDVTSTWWFGTAMCKIVLYIQVSPLDDFAACYII
ncbi:hypothetical protein GWI33_014441 [Rhynchophorus ferrugineus]|uniref:G-protein coupled receptors family 1 profile domain-containing protein n=1 Tax=Rhynchophorus ferrugineus TaxID=354439 RepID=A0A834MCC6_RHYFE|nr:hypothetical protein GWI33_014441 [Rhynchophorus ferrugineus]